MATQPIDKHDPSVLIAVLAADGHLIGGTKRLDDGSLYAWLDVPGCGRRSCARELPDDAEAFLEDRLDAASDAGAIDISKTTTSYAPEQLGDRTQRARAAQIVALRAASPMRPAPGKTHDVDGLALFDHARQPTLI